MARAEAPRGTTTSPDITLEELALAARNHGMPLEALRYDVTPVGLHYLLIHYDIPDVDAASWRLQIGGSVTTPLTPSVDDLRARPAVTRPVTMECAGNGRARLSPRTISQPWLFEAVGTATWTGTPLAPLLREAGLSTRAVEVVFTGLDRGVEGGVAQNYERSLPVAEALRDDVLLAYELNGQPLPPQHGYPVRLLVPGWYGMTSVKWLARITAVDAPFDGYQMTRGYRIRHDPDDVGEPVSRIAVRSLMVPPGVPEFLTRSRYLAAGPCELVGRAWSGRGEVTAVDVSTDGGATWVPAAVEPPPSPFAWQRWTATWEAATGEYEVVCRATDATGDRQPLETPWHIGGYSVNAVQRVPVTVTPTGTPG